jgi:hypothetical protein
MPDHIHMVMRKHKHLAEEMIEHFQDASRSALIKGGARANEHPVWGGPGWKVFRASGGRSSRVTTTGRYTTVAD